MKEDIFLPKQEELHSSIITEMKQGLSELFLNSKNPIEVLVAQMETDEYKDLPLPQGLREQKITELREFKFEDEGGFISGVINIMKPILKITKKGKETLHEKGDRDMYTPEDLKSVTEVVKKNKCEKIYVVGNVGSGKSTFSRELSAQTGIRNIDMDHFFQIYKNEKGVETDDIRVILDFVKEKVKPPFIINHANLLQMGLVEDADMVVLLQPKIEEQLKSREVRSGAGAEGEWQSVDPLEYESINEKDREFFNQVEGDVLYGNNQSGTFSKFRNPPRRVHR